jgi:hypothetical protein
MSQALGRRRGWGIALLVVGILLDLAGSAAFAYGAVTAGGPWIALGQLWYRLDVASLNLVQAVVQRSIDPRLWDPVIVAILLQPAFVVLSLPGALLLILAILLLRPWRG